MKGNFPSIERVWVYAASRRFSEAERLMIQEALEQFTGDWSDHGVRLQSGYDILYDRFIILTGKNPHGRVDGCAIDSSIQFMKQLGEKLDINFLDRMRFYYLEGNQVQSATRPQIVELYEAGKIVDDTLFFNPLVQTREEYDKSWVLPFKKHWLKKMLVPQDA